MRWSKDEVLLTTDVGEFQFLDRSEFDVLVNGILPSASSTFRNLKSKHFIVDGSGAVPVELLSTKYRSKKSFLHGFTRLHIFVVTLRCDHSCQYCQVSRVADHNPRHDMSRETAERSIDLMFRSPAKELKVEFQGGEPLLKFELIRWIIERIQERNHIEGRDIQYVIATTLGPLTDEMLELFALYRVHLSTSLDGPVDLHNANRPRPGRDSHQRLVGNLERARASLGREAVSALMTTTERSLALALDIVDEYVRLGFDTIFVRPISPYGFAARSGAAFRYATERFVEFYLTALNHIIALNRSGIPIVEVYAQILLQKILTPFPTGYVDLQSPGGAGIATVVYNYDGDVYASDEGRMLAETGDRSFRLGNVHRDEYREIFGGRVVKALVEVSCSEVLPGCTDCAFLPFCGADPVFNWTTQHDPFGHRPTSAFCARNMGLLRYFFELLRGNDRFTRDLLVAWATGNSIPSGRPA